MITAHMLTAQAAIRASYQQVETGPTRAGARGFVVNKPPKGDKLNTNVALRQMLHSPTPAVFRQRFLGRELAL